jgi:hypothetical protein
MDRIAPKGGYTGGTKRHYRRNIWAAFRDSTGSARAEAHALLMPSAEGVEVDVALKAGFREHNLVLVDRNPAIAAHLKRRYPLATCYGVDVAVAADRIAASGVRLSIGNLDLCGTISGKVPRSLQAVLESGAIADCAMLAVTMLRGREKGVIGRTIGECGHMKKPFTLVTRERGRVLNVQTIAAQDAIRLFAVIRAAERAGWTFGLRRLDKYRSTAGNQTMLWCAGWFYSPEFQRLSGSDCCRVTLSGELTLPPANFFQ